MIKAINKNFGAFPLLSVLMLTASCSSELATDPAANVGIACNKCSCSALEADPEDAQKCKSCLHAASDHTRREK